MSVAAGLSIRNLDHGTCGVNLGVSSLPEGNGNVTGA